MLKKILLSITAFLLFALTVYAINTVATGYKMLSAANTDVDAHGTCKTITNSTGKDIFVSTYSSAGWNSFITNTPSGVSLADCSTGPTNLSLSHTTRSSGFTASWTGAGSGITNCVIQSYNGGWVTITTVDCNADAASQGFTLANANVGSNWNGTQVRLAADSGATELAVFPETLVCTTKSGSSSSTPTVDEDCDGQFNDYTTQNYAGCQTGTCKSAYEAYGGSCGSGPGPGTASPICTTLSDGCHGGSGLYVIGSTSGCSYNVRTYY